MLRSNKENARYMAATGNRITAQEMKYYGLVERVAGESILEDALDLATRDKIPVDFNVPSKDICSREKLNKIISERTDARRYQELEKKVSRKLQTNELSNDKGREDYVGSFINHELDCLGKPLAPLAVAAVMELIDQFSDISWKDLGRIKEMGEQEAQSCFRLMKTLDRRIGVNSVLTSNPVERIPVYVGK
jgi:enoyl-CoA hydratase/carnithine racemase